MPLSTQEISDRFEIQDLLIRYTRAIDTRDYALLDTCFLPDAYVDYVRSGGIKGKYPEVRAWLEKAPWILDFDAAKAESKKSGKPIFAYFTRSYAP